MTSNELDSAIERLSIVRSDPARAERTRRRCRALLERQQRPGGHLATLDVVRSLR